MPKEIELSFIFDYNKTKEMVKNINNFSEIVDYYIDENHRIRITPDEIFATKKNGDKSSGMREEIDIELDYSEEIIEFAESCSKLKIEKTRYYYDSLQNFTIDLVESPIKVAILEIEFDNKEDLKKTKQDANEAGLIESGLNAWNYCKRKIAIAGGPSSGKTSIAKGLCLNLNNNYNANASDVVEYATSFIQRENRIPIFEDSCWIYTKQSEREQTVAKTANIVISDCPPFLSYIYAVRQMRKMESSPHTDFALQALYKRAVHSLKAYEQIIVMNLVEYKENGVRYHNKKQSLEIREDIIKFLENHGRRFKSYNYNQLNDITKDVLYMNEFNNMKKFLSSNFFLAMKIT